MRKLTVTLAAIAVQVLFLAGVASAQTSAQDGTSQSFRDDFDTLDTTRWSKGEHGIGRSYLDPANVSVAGGELLMKIPARTLNGGEIVSNELYRYGSYSARMKVPYAPSSITGFFMYKAPDFANEIDIEIFNDRSRRIMFTTYAGAADGPTNTEILQLPFDPTEGYHDYRFDYSTGSVSFYVDGTLMKTWNQDIPSDSMYLMTNVWFPTWLDGKKPRKNAYLRVDSIEHTAQPDAFAMESFSEAAPGDEPAQITTALEKKPEVAPRKARSQGKAKAVGKRSSAKGR